jgi:hypothetical protein
MDDATFDALTRAFTAGFARRRVLAGLSSALLVTLPLALEAYAAANKKRRRKRRRKHRKKNRRSSAPSPLVPPIPPPLCVGNCEGKNCGDDGCGGSCGTCSGAAVCQGGRCTCPTGRVQCAGRCCDRGQICVAGNCLAGQGTCPNGADSCLGENISCNQNATCVCFQTPEGRTRCGQPRLPETECGNCTNSATCEAAFPGTPGIFCAVYTIGPASCGCTEGEGACVPPCSS